MSVDYRCIGEAFRYFLFHVAVAARHLFVFDNAGHPFRPLLRGINFPIQVWGALLAILQGALVPHGDVVATASRPASYRAAARATGNNRVVYLILCHRESCANRYVGGYRCYPARKIAMLRWDAEYLDVAVHA